VKQRGPCKDADASHQDTTLLLALPFAATRTRPLTRTRQPRVGMVPEHYNIYENAIL